MPTAAHGAELLGPAVPLDMPEGLTLETPQWLGGVSPDREHTQQAQVKGIQEYIPERHHDLAHGFSATVTCALSKPPCKGDTRVSQDGAEGEPDRAS